MRVAIVEFSPWHGEILPSLADAAIASGAQVDVYVHQGLMPQRPFSPQFLQRIRLRSWSVLGGRVYRLFEEMARYDVAVISTLEPSAHVLRARRFRCAVAGVVHRGHVLRSNPTVNRFFQDRAHPIVLSPHVKKYLDKWDTTLIRPVELGQCEIGSGGVDVSGRVRLAVQGFLRLDGRDYAALLAALAELPDRGERFEVVIAGDPEAFDGWMVRELINEARVRTTFRFTRVAATYPEIYHALSECDFILPLLHAGQCSHIPFLRDRSSSSIWVGLGCGAIPVAETSVVEAYGIADVAVSYEAGSLLQALKSVSEMSPLEIEHRRAAVRSYASALKIENTSAMGALLKRLSTR